jgi:hypothetical protein
MSFMGLTSLPVHEVVDDGDGKSTDNGDADQESYAACPLISITISHGFTSASAQRPQAEHQQLVRTLPAALRRSQ